jgi:chromosomal replication initiator protein
MDRPQAESGHPLDGFVVGPENALAHASVLRLARGEGAGLSPLVVHGPAGVGKSRLLAGLVAERLLRRPGDAAAHLGAEAFAALCAEAAGPGGWADLRARFRPLDLFVLEDLHALDRAPLALAELAHTLDALEESGAAVAVSARAGPGQWATWPRRLVNRLSGGLAVRVDPPGPASRRRFLLEAARARGVALSAEAVEALAGSADGYRTLDGWLARLALASRVAGPRPGPLDRAAVGAWLAEDVAAAGPDDARSLDRIARAVAGRFGVRLSDLRSASRRQALVVPRHLAIHVARSRTGLSFAALGAYFGGRDAATVRHACRAAARRLADDPALAASVADLAPPDGGAPRPGDPAPG